MNTQTHLLLAAGLLCKPDAPRRNAAVLAGAFIPDGALFGMFAWSKLAGIPEPEFWGTFYFGETAQAIQALANSAPLYALLAVIGLAMARSDGPGLVNGQVQSGTPAPYTLLFLFAVAALTHLAGDFPVHVADAHRHLWPLSDWRFRSPVSYWDPAHYGTWFSLFEIALGVTLAVVLFRRFSALWVRALMLIAVAAYVAVPAYFIFMIAGHDM